LSPNLYEHLRAKFDQTVLAAIPCRDALMLFSEQVMSRSELLSAVAADFKDSDRSISDRLFQLTPDGVELALPRDKSPPEESS
jgi:hypothetical protein